MIVSNRLRVIELLLVLQKESKVSIWHYWQHNTVSLQMDSVPHLESIQLGLPCSGQQDFTVQLPIELQLHHNQQKAQTFPGWQTKMYSVAEQELKAMSGET